MSGVGETGEGPGGGNIPTHNGCMTIGCVSKPYLCLVATNLATPLGSAGHRKFIDVDELPFNRQVVGQIFRSGRAHRLLQHQELPVLVGPPGGDALDHGIIVELDDLFDG
jgi:hypothetical protein